MDNILFLMVDPCSRSGIKKDFKLISKSRFLEIIRAGSYPSDRLMYTVLDGYESKSIGRMDLDRFEEAFKTEIENDYFNEDEIYIYFKKPIWKKYTTRK